MSLPHLYWHFLTVQNHLDQEAAKRQQEGKNGAWLREYFQQQLRFSDGQIALVRSTAQRLQTELEALDAQAKAIIDREHAARAQQASVSGSWGLVPDELKALDQKHEDLIQTEVSNLKPPRSRPCRAAGCVPDDRGRAGAAAPRPAFSPHRP